MYSEYYGVFFMLKTWSAPMSLDFVGLLKQQSQNMGRWRGTLSAFSCDSGLSSLRSLGGFIRLQLALKLPALLQPCSWKDVLNSSQTICLSLFLVAQLQKLMLSFLKALLDCVCQFSAQSIPQISAGRPCRSRGFRCFDFDLLFNINLYVLFLNDYSRSLHITFMSHADDPHTKSPNPKPTSPSRIFPPGQKKPKPKNPIPKPQVISDIFRGVSFCFPQHDAVLSGVLIGLLKEQILANGGAVFEVGQIWLTPKRYYLASEKAPMAKLKKFLEELDGMVLHYSYIKECVAKKRLIDTDQFRIDAPQIKSLGSEIRRQIQQVQQDRINNEKKMKCIQTKLEDKGFKIKAQKDKRERNLSLISELHEATKVTADNSNSNALQSENSITQPLQPEKESDELDKFKRPRQYLNDPEVKEGEKPRKALKTELQQSPKKPEMDVESDNEHIQKSAEKRYWDDQKQQFAEIKVPTIVPALNTFICEELTKLQKIYQVEKDKGRAIAYTKAVAAIKSLKTQIRDKSDIMNVPGIGPKIRDKIMELIETGRLNKLQRFQKDVKYETINKLCEVWGIGPATASDLYSRGIKTIEDLRKHEHLLTKNQRMGLKYFEEFKQKIPRSEVQKIEAIVKDTVFNLVDSSTLHIVETCGSYRRGKDFCGDIDIIITRKDGKFQKDLIFRLYQKLMQIGLITDHLSLPRHNQEHESFSYMGVCQLDGGLHRRLDIKYYPSEEFAYALLYFTGSDMFNRALRIVAHKKGYKLSDHCMVPLDTDKEKEKGNKKKVVCYTEADILKFLGMEYRAPKDRNTT